MPAVVRALERDTVALNDHIAQVEATPASVADLLRVHTPEHLARVRDAVSQAAAAGSVERLASDTPVSGASWDAALAAAGAGISAVEVIGNGEARNAFCATRPPGRWASADTSGHFSLFNNVAVVARHLADRHGVNRVLIVDWGVEPGAGTASIFASDPAVEVLPWAGEPLVLEAAVAGFEPEWILLSAELVGDSRMIFRWTESVRQCAERVCHGRLVSLLEGGFQSAELGACAVQHVRALAGLPPA